MNIFRQGDVLLKEARPKNKTKLLYSGMEYVLAEGEATGHKHTLKTRELPFTVVTDIVTGERFLEINEPATITHQEHKPLVISPGIYSIVIEEEYDPFNKSMRQIQD